MQAVVVVLKWVGLAIAAIVVLLAFVLVVLPPLTRGFTNRWGATDAEVASAMAGDDLVTAPEQNSTRAVTVKATPELVFALVRQMGYGRGGWYAWDWFYQLTGSANFVDGHHTTRVDPNLQRFGKGSTMELFPAAKLTAVAYDPPRAIVLYKNTDAANQQLPVGATDGPHSDMSWAWIVDPQPDGTTRLILRTRSSNVGMPGFVRWLYDQPLEMGGAVFGYKTLVGIKRIAEKLSSAGVVVDTNGLQTAGPLQ
jgi:hypothetical protein